MLENVKIRRLTREDIPAIRHLTKDIWDGEDYIPHVIDKWLAIPQSHLLGFFLSDPNLNGKEILAAFGRISANDQGLAWIDGGRVDPAYQKSGLGKLMLSHFLNLAKAWGMQKVQYDTSSQNFGSIRLAKHFGLTEKTEMCAYIYEFPDVYPNSTPQIPCPPSIPIEEAYQRLHQSLHLENLNLGWSYIPCTETELKLHTRRWYAQGDAIILWYEDFSDATRETPQNGEVWFIVYGKFADARDLLQDILEQVAFQRQNGHLAKRPIWIFCPPDLERILLDLGCHSWKNQLERVILFEKHLI
jgi:GNAT superfamily N-acetyltransferase